jgi:hypothetical protein
MSIKEPVHPAERYVNLFLIDLFMTDTPTRAVRQSNALPALAGFDYVPEFARFRNRLKIMANLDPVTYPTPRAGSAEIAIDREVDGAWFQFGYTLHLLFDDAATDPSVEMRVELTSREPTFDPALLL